MKRTFLKSLKLRILIILELRFFDRCFRLFCFQFFFASVFVSLFFSDRYISSIIKSWQLHGRRIRPKRISEAAPSQGRNSSLSIVTDRSFVSILLCRRKKFCECVDRWSLYSSSLSLARLLKKVCLET
jgi:hypothetical protein